MNMSEYLITFKTGITSIEIAFCVKEAEILAQAKQIKLGNDYRIINTIELKKGVYSG